jgi:cytochrome c oxidase assembly protein subunit 15
MSLVAMLGMGGAQGLIGWWMVKSGLEQPKTEHHEPKVSPYRLTVHLVSAFFIYSLLLATALRTTYGPSKAAIAGGVSRTLKFSAAAVTALIGTTIVSGAFVAGNHVSHHLFYTFTSAPTSTLAGIDNVE